MPDRSGCKVDRVAERYEIDDPRHATLGDGLLARWRGEGDHEEHGYRTLTDWFNKRILRTVYESAGRRTLGNRIESDFAALTGEDDIVRDEVVADLRADGVDAAALTDDFVSWGTIRTHLTDCLDGEKSAATSADDWQRETVEMARSFAASKAEEAVSSLGTNGVVDGVDAATVDVSIRLRCERCPTVVPIDVAIQRGYVCDDHRSESLSRGADQS